MIWASRTRLTEPSTNLAQWRSMLQMALGANGQLMVDLVPALERLIGPQAPLQTLRPTEARNRFELVFQNFVRVFCTSTTPLVLFLDDLQWADPATLSLLQLLLADPAGGHLLVVGAYRDTEVEAAHPLRALIQQLGHQRVAITELTLGPLDRASVRELLAAAEEAAGHILEPTALVHEAWLKLGDASFQNRAHFFGAAYSGSATWWRAPAPCADRRPRAAHQHRYRL